MSTELVVRPGRIDDRGFTDLAPHRQPLPSVYNRYSLRPRRIRIYSPDREPQQMLLWPLFVTSFVVDDFLGDHQLFGATRAVISSASAKTSIAAAFLLAGRPGIEVVGLTSPANLDFVRSLDCYHRVVDLRGGCVADPGRHLLISTSPDGRRQPTRCTPISAPAFATAWWSATPTGITRSEGAGPPPGPTPTFLFAPDQITKRRREWGRDGFEQIGGRQLEPVRPVDRLVADAPRRRRSRRGGGGLSVISCEGRVDPRVGDVCTLDAAAG